MNIIEAINKARKTGAGITNPELKRAGIFLYSLYNDTSLEVRRIDDGFEGIDGRLIPDWRPTPMELCADDWGLFSKDENVEPEVTHAPQMLSEKKELANLLINHLRDTINNVKENGYDYEDPIVLGLTDIARIAADLVK